jgi:chromosome segregation ATPase
VDDAPLSPSEAARLLKISEEEAGELDGRVLLELARELARAREEVGRLSGQLKEVRATNLRLQKEVKESAEERRRLTEEVMELRAAAEERLMLMERIERIAHIEQTLAESEAQLERLRSRRLLARLLNHD